MGFFVRKILAGGQILEVIEMYNRVYDMFDLFSAADSRNNDFGEGFISSWEYRAASNSITDAHAKGFLHHGQ